MAWVGGYAGIRMRVPDHEAAAKLYRDVIGMEVAAQDAHSITLKTPEGMEFVIEDGGEYCEPASGYTHICLDTYDSDYIFETLCAMGGKPSRGENSVGEDRVLHGSFARNVSGEELEIWYIIQDLSDPKRRDDPPGGNYLRAFAHLAMTVPDAPAASAFYQALGVGLKDDINHLLFDNKHEMEIFPGGEACTNASGIVEMSLFTDDARACYDTALAHGGQGVSISPDGREAVVLGVGGERVRFVYLPEGQRPQSQTVLPRHW